MFAQNHEPSPQVFVLQRFKLIKNREQYDRRQLRQQNEQSHEQSPRQHPPVLRPLPDREVQQFHHDAAEHQPNQKFFHFIPSPSAEPLIGKFESALQLE